jgi:tetraacyldisaccharide 4'-kinase
VRAPDFWIKGGPLSLALAPLGWLWAAGARRRQSQGRPQRAPIPVICVGNLVVGGAGKTPVARSIANRINGAHFLSAGYGGTETGPLLVDPHRHSHLRVGDEPLLLSEIAPCWVAKNRLAGARAAAAQGASCVIMDDGYQDPSLAKTVSLVVIDGHVGFGSGRCMPAGPLRESIEDGLKRATAIVLLGEDRRNAERYFGYLPVIRAKLEPEAEVSALAGQHVVAFAGIARPEKFFHTLEHLGAKVVEAYSFPDHYPYHPNEIVELKTIAETRSAALLTTTKDFVRVPSHLRDGIATLRMTVTWEDEAAMLKIVAPAAKRP